MGRYTYVPSEGEAQYRRTLYAFWRRSITPTFLFDSAQRRSCEVRMARTNTPLQALTLLNDDTYLEASRALADQSLALPLDQRLKTIYRRVLARWPSATELVVLKREHDRALLYYGANANAATSFVAVGQRPPVKAAAELAATMLVASMILNLDEAITHE